MPFIGLPEKIRRVLLWTMFDPVRWLVRVRKEAEGEIPSVKVTGSFLISQDRSGRNNLPSSG